MPGISRLNNRTIAAPTSVAAGAATDTGDCNFGQGNVTLSGSFVATYQLQGSNDGGANWINVGSALTAPAAVSVTSSWLQLRWNCTAYTSGTPTSTFTAAPL